MAGCTDGKVYLPYAFIILSYYISVLVYMYVLIQPLSTNSYNLNYAEAYPLVDRTGENCHVSGDEYIQHTHYI